MAVQGQHGPGFWGPILDKHAVGAEFGVAAGVRVPQSDDEAASRVQGNGQLAAQLGLSIGTGQFTEVGVRLQISPSRTISDLPRSTDFPSLDPDPLAGILLGFRARTSDTARFLGEMSIATGGSVVAYSQRAELVRYVENRDANIAVSTVTDTRTGSRFLLHFQLSAAFRANLSQRLSTSMGLLLTTQNRVDAVVESTAVCTELQATRISNDCNSEKNRVAYAVILLQPFAEVTWRVQNLDVGLMIHGNPMANADEVLFGGALRLRPWGRLPEE